MIDRGSVVFDYITEGFGVVVEPYDGGTIVDELPVGIRYRANTTQLEPVDGREHAVRLCGSVALVDRVWPQALLRAIEDERGPMGVSR